MMEYNVVSIYTGNRLLCFDLLAAKHLLFVRHPLYKTSIKCTIRFFKCNPTTNPTLKQ